MLTYLLNRGPLAVCVDATMWASYVAGTSTSPYLAPI